MRKQLLSVLCVAALHSTAGAVCRLPQPRHVCQEYFSETAVVMARLMRIRHVEELHPGSPDGNYYFMEVVQRLKGKPLKRFQVYEENSSGRATFEWKRGEEYLLFLSYSDYDRGWELDGCGNSAPLASAKNALDDIARIRAGQEQEIIEGEIASEETLPERVMVKVEGAGKTRTLPVENRQFKVRVQPGTYTVTPVASGWMFQKDEFSYDDPAKIVIQPGRCAQVQFQATPAR